MFALSFFLTSKLFYKTSFLTPIFRHVAFIQCILCLYSSPSFLPSSEDLTFSGAWQQLLVMQITWGVLVLYCSVFTFLFYPLRSPLEEWSIKETGACKASWDISLLLCQELGVALELYSVTLPLLSVISRPSNLYCFHLQPWLWHGCLASFRFLGGGFQILLFGLLIKSERPGDPSMWELLLLTAVVSWF